MFFFQAEDGIRYLVRSRGLGDVYKRQRPTRTRAHPQAEAVRLGTTAIVRLEGALAHGSGPVSYTHLTLPTSDLV